MADLAQELENMDDDKLEELAAEGDQVSAEKMTQSDEDEIDNKVINHNHMFSVSKGGPQVKQGDAQFEEEQGGASQIFDVHTRIACENIRSDDDVEDELADDGNITDEDQEDIRQDDQPTPSDYVSTAAVPSPVKSGDSTIDITSAEKRSAKSESCGTPDDKVTVDTVETPPPSPMKSPPNNRRKITDQNNANNDGVPLSPGHSSQLSPDRNATDRSTCSFEGLRTQPTSQQPTQKAPRAKKTAPTKICIMGKIFENKDQQKANSNNNSAKTKSNGLYIPTYCRK